MRNLSLARFVAVASLVGCSGGPGLGPGVTTRVTLLAGGFVRFEGARIPEAQFVLTIRERVRAAGDDIDGYPAVYVLAEDGLPMGRLDKLVRELQSAGVRFVSLG